MPKIPQALAGQLEALLREGAQLGAGHHEPPLGMANAERTDKGFRVELPKAMADDDEDTGGGTVTASESGKATRLYIYSDIGGWFGVWPEDIVAALSDISGDVELHLHSPGGDAFDGVAIYNAFRNHNEDPDKGFVDVEIDGLAASAASVIAMAGRKVKVRKGGQMMIHDAWGYAVGPAEDMDKMREFLDKISSSIASIYAAKAGGSDEDWRTAMKAESWYTDREAVEAGLADTMDTATESAKNAWDLKVFAHAGRADAPTPPMPAGRYELGTWNGVMARHPGDAGVKPLVDLDALARMVAEERGRTTTTETPAQAAARIHAAAQRAVGKTPDTNPVAGPSSTEGGSAMPQAYDPAKIREALGLGPDATDAEVTTAWSAAFGAPAPAPNPAPEPPPTAGPAPANLSALAEMARKQGVILMDPAQLDEMRDMAARGQMAYNAQKASERDEVINRAVETGRIALSRVEDWRKSWDAEVKTGGTGEKTRELLESLSPNLVPMEAQGYAGMASHSDAENRLFDLYPEMKPQGGRR